MKLSDTNFNDVLVTILFLSYMLATFGGTAYLIQVYDWSPWWFLMTFCMMVKIKTGSKK